MGHRDGIRERYGVRLGMRVRDVDGKSLGRVDALYDSGFSVLKGLPILFRSDFVARYDEVRELRGDELVLARSSRDLFTLARGEIPPAWRVSAAPDHPTAATPSEAHTVYPPELPSDPHPHKAS
jgi:hypothetical protein